MFCKPHWEMVVAAVVLGPAQKRKPQVPAQKRKTQVPALAAMV